MKIDWIFSTAPSYILHHHHHYHHISVMELGHLTRSGLTYPEVSSKVCHDSFCQLGNSQGCPLSPTLFNIYLDEIITKWQKQDITRIKLLKNQQLSTLLFADDQVIIADREDNLQRATRKLNQIITKYGLTISVQKKN